MKTSFVHLTSTLSLFFLPVLSVSADSITDGLGWAGDSIYGYIPYVQAIGFVLSAIVGTIGAFAIYYAIIKDDRNAKNKIIYWGTGTIACLTMSISLPNFFAYQESGYSGIEGGMADGSMAGGDNYGTIMTEIPSITSSSWAPDIRYWTFETTSGTQITGDQYIASIFEHSQGSTDAETEMNAFNNLHDQYHSSNLDYSTFNGLMSYLMMNGYFNNLPSNYH